MMLRTLLVAALLASTGCAQAQPAAGAQAQAPSSGDGANYLATNAKAKGVVTLPSGLQYKVVKAGPATGIKPGPNDQVKVHYEGRLIDGTVFDSSYERGAPIVARPTNLVPGWTEALQLMRPGDEWELYLPPALGYGDQPAGPIPPGSVLVFKIELLDVLPAAAG